MSKRFFKLLLFLLLFAAACKPVAQRYTQPDSETETDQGGARVSLYLEAFDQSRAQITVRLIKVEIGNGQLWQEADIVKRHLERRDLEGQQLFLGKARLAPGTYRSLRLTFSDAAINGKAILTAGAAHQVVLPIAKARPFNPGSSSCLFIDWFAISEVMGENLFSAFAARFQTPILARNLITVLCRNINTLYQITPDQNRVVAAFSLSGALGETAFDPNRRRLYVVGTEIRGLYVIDAASSRLIDTFSLPLTQAPAALALTADGRSAIVSDTLTNRILKVDLESGFIALENRNILRPERITIFGESGQERVAILSTSERKVVILEAATLKQISSISINGVPAAAAILDKQLFIADRSSDHVLVYALPEGRFEYYLKVGREPLELAVFGRRVYVAAARENYLSLLIPRQKTPLRRVFCNANPVDVAISQNWRKIYTANLINEQISIIDLNSGSLLRQVELGGQPSEITILEL